MQMDPSSLDGNPQRFGQRWTGWRGGVIRSVLKEALNDANYA